MGKGRDEITYHHQRERGGGWRGKERNDVDDIRRRVQILQKREKAERPSVNRSVSRTLSCSRFPANQTERKTVRQDRQNSAATFVVVVVRRLPALAPTRSRPLSLSLSLYLSLSTLSCSLHVSAEQ